MVKNNQEQSSSKKYIVIGIVAVVVIAVAVAGVFLLKKYRNNTPVDNGVSVAEAISDVTPDAASGATMRIAVVRMDAIQTDSKVLKDLRAQKEKYEDKLRDDLTKRQKELEKEKEDIEKSQDVLSREALQRRVVEYQGKVSKLQRDLTEGAQSIESSFQKALAQIQEKHLDPIVEGIIAKKKLSLVIDGRMARTGNDIANLDITADVINALDKKVSSVKMDNPKDVK